MKSYNEIIKVAKHPPERKIDIVSLISEQRKLPIPVVKKGIKQGQLTINSKPVQLLEIILKPSSLIRFQNIVINTNKFINKNEFDNYVDLVLIELGEESLATLKSPSRKPFCSYLLAYFANNNLEQVVESKSKSLDSAVIELEGLYRDNFKDGKVAKVPKRKELIETLVNLRTECFDELSGLIINLNDGVFSTSLYKFLQEYTKIINRTSFQNLIAPLLSSSIYSRSAIDALIKPITDAREINEIDKRLNHFDNSKEQYNAYLGLIDNKNGLQVRIFKRIGGYLFDLFKKECDTIDVKSAEIKISSTGRNYNFSNHERTEYDLFFNIHNIGQGLARDLSISSKSNVFRFTKFSVGLLKPGESREISIATSVRTPITSPVLIVECSWTNLDGISKKETSHITFGIQMLNIPWDELAKRKPYTIQEIEDRDKLYGRDEILKELEQNILSDKIESYKIWGQKRVGKSSIVKTLKSLFNDREKAIVIWRSVAGLKNTDALLTLNTLGESICSEIFEEIDNKVQSSGIKEALRAIQVPEFNGSLLPLENYVKKLKRIDDSLRFVIIIDEFDRINEEFFLPGNLGETLSLNIGKGLNSLSYVGFVLVGSENMHLLDRQEINYNSFQNREVDTFNKEREFESFKKIIIGPVSPHIVYSNEAIEKIYDVTNGNPYFANLICSNIFNICLKLKDNEVDVATVIKSLSLIIDSYQKSHFEHFWVDGITEDSNIRRERKSDIRRRILVSYSFCYFQTACFPTRSDIIRNFKKPMEYEIEGYEIENTITEFYNRKIFFEESNTIRIKPLIFEQWLCGPGRTLMIEGISDLEALQREKQLEAEHSLKEEELARIGESLKFHGQKLKLTELNKYFRQFGGPFEQRRIYNLIDKITYTSKNEIIEFIKSEQKNIYKRSELTIKSNIKSPYREDVELYSFPTTLNENRDIFETFKLFSLIRKTKTLKDIRSNKEAWKNSGAEDIVIFESLIDDFTFIQQDLLNLLDEKIISERIPVKLVSLIITSKAKADLIKATSGYSNFKLIHYKELDESRIKPFIDTTEVFETTEEARYAFAEVRKHYPETSRECVNVLFETHCPGKSIPVLWHSTPQFTSLFHNPDGVFYKEVKQEDGEQFRDRIYKANVQLTQAINRFLVGYVKEKARKNGKLGDDDWFSIEYVPKTIMEKIFQKWMDDGSKQLKETYFDLIHYKELIKKHAELLPLFEIKEDSGDKLKWIDKVNELRRDPAHPEKPPPTIEQAQYFEQKKDEILKRLSTYQKPPS